MAIRGFNLPSSGGATPVSLSLGLINSAAIAFDMPSIHVRACAVIICSGSVLLHRVTGDGFWALPGGRIELGEDGVSAVKRELLEELDEQVIVEELLFIAENFFTHDSQQYHEVGLYFRTHFHPVSDKVRKKEVFFGIEPSKRLEFSWFSQGQLSTLDIRPSFLRESLSFAEPRFQHVVENYKGDEA